MDNESVPIEPVAVALGLALKQMPMEAPEHSAWPALAAELARRQAAAADGARRRASRWPRWPLAVAASLLVGLFALPRLVGTPDAPAGATAAATTAEASQAQLAALMTESARLERLVAAADDSTSSASAAALSLELEDQLGTLDGALQASTDAGQQLALWEQRVQVLRDVAAVATARRYLAAEGRDLDAALVAAY